MDSDSEEDRRWMQQWRRHMLGLMLSITFCGGALVGLLASSLGLPGVWWAPLFLAATGVFWLAVGRPRGDASGYERRRRAGLDPSGDGSAGGQREP